MEYAAFLRAINVGGKSKLPMEDLRRLAADLGFQNVKTYIQTGNLVFSAEAEPAVVSSTLENALLTRFGLKVPVALRTRAELAELLAANPFDGAPGTLHISLFDRAPSSEARERLEDFDTSRDRFRVSGREGYLLCPDTYNDTPFSNAALEKVLGVKSTTRKADTLQATLNLFA